MSSAAAKMRIIYLQVSCALGLMHFEVSWVQLTSGACLCHQDILAPTLMDTAAQLKLAIQVYQHGCMAIQCREECLEKHVFLYYF